jgi:predicted lactoylglutathione lyase
MTTFGPHLSEFINRSLAQGVAPQEIIVTLEVCKIELVNSLLSHALGAAAAKPAEPMIVLPPNGRVAP